MRYGMLFSLVCAAMLITGSKAKAFDPEMVLKTVAPFIDEHTLILLRSDLGGDDVEAELKLLRTLLPFPDDAEFQEFLKAARTIRVEIRKAGIRELFVVYGPSDFPTPPCFLVPLEGRKGDPDVMKNLARQLGIGTPLICQEMHGCQCIGTREAIERLKQRKAVARPDFAEALAACKDSTHQLILAPGIQARKIVEELLPTFPAELGGGSIHVVTREMKWATLSVGPAPRFHLRFQIRTTSEQASRDMSLLLGKGFELLEKEIPSEDDPEFTALRKLLAKTRDWVKPKITPNELLISQDLGLILPQVGALLKEMVPGDRRVEMNHLKQLGLAIHNYEGAFGVFPADIRSKDGKPLLSWRVAILPFIEQDQLYLQFKLDEPWDSENNKKLIPLMPAVFRSPYQEGKPNDRTCYLAPRGKGTMWDNPKGVKILEVTDGTSNTILLVRPHNDQAVIWSRPADLPIDPKMPTRGLISPNQRGFYALMVDGSVRLVDKTYSAIYAMFTRAGGEVLPEK